MSGGTGGHLWPALTLAEALRAAGHRTSLVTEGRAVERSILARAGERSVDLPSCGRGLRRLAGVPRATIAARRVLRDCGVDAVIGTGGGTTLPVGLAARSLGLPLCLLEQNAVVGRVNRVLQPLARRVYLGLPARRARPDAMLTGTPIRAGFGKLTRAEARRRLGLDQDRPMLLVTGGSQGASVLNQIVPPAVELLGQPLQVLHLTGDGEDDAVRTRYSGAIDDGVDAVVRPLALDMPELFAAADLVVCRGGGCTVSELIAAGRPAIIVPYPHHADRQQSHNGHVLGVLGAAVVVEQCELTPARLRELLAKLLTDPARLAAMGASASAIAPGDAAGKIVADLEEVVDA